MTLIDIDYDWLISDINECDPNPCANGGLCVDGVNGYTCACAAEWTGPNCEISE